MLACLTTIKVTNHLLSIRPKAIVVILALLASTYISLSINSSIATEWQPMNFVHACYILLSSATATYVHTYV